MDHGRNQHDESEVSAAWLRTAGAALLAAAAVFFAGETLWRPGHREFVARAVVGSPASTGNLATQFDLEAIRAQLNAAAPGEKSLNVYRQYQADGSAERRVAIELTSEREAEAVATVDRLSRQLLSRVDNAANKSAGASPELASAQARLATAQAKEDAARRTLDALTKQHFDSVRQLEQSAAEIAPVPVAVEAPRQRKLNPVWSRLQGQLESLEAKREGLLMRLTDEHPQVRDIDAELAELQSRLKATSRWEAADPVAEHTPAATAAEDQAALVAKVKAVAGERTKYRAAVEAYEVARGERFEAQAAVEILSEPSNLIASAASPSRWELVEASHIVERIPAIPSLTRWLVLAGLAVVAAFGVLAVLRPRTPSARKSDPAVDIEALLGMPVIARLARSGRA